MTDDFLVLLDEKIADASANIASCERMGYPHAAWSQQVIVCEALRTAYLAYREKIVKALEAEAASAEDTNRTSYGGSEYSLGCAWGYAQAIKIVRGE